MKENVFMPERFYSIDETMSIEKLIQVKESGGFVVVKVIAWNLQNECLEVELGNNLNAVIALEDFTIYPTKHSDGFITPNVYTLIGENICACVKSLESGKIVLSRAENMRKALNFLKDNSTKIYSCMVLSIKKYGAFVDICSGLTGFIHVSELTRSFVKSPIDVGFNTGSYIDCSILDIKEDPCRIKLTHKLAVENIAQKLTPGKIVEVISLFPVSKSHDGYYVYINDNTSGIMDVKSNSKKIPYGKKVKAFVKPTKSSKPDLARLNFLYLLD